MRFVFIDSITELLAGERIVCQHTWPDTLELFEDHFPDFAVVPGVLLTEMMGQAGALCLETAPEAPGKAMLVKIKDATFKQWVRPQELIEIDAEVLQSNVKTASIKATARVADRTVATCKLLFTWSEGNLGLPAAMHPAVVSYQAKREQP